MWSYVAEKLAIAVLVLFGISVLVFVAVHYLPGDAATYMTGDSATPEVVSRLRAELGLDQPLTVQYGRWLWGAVRGDLGRSLTDHRPVAARVTRNYRATLALSVFGLLIAMVVGVLAGIVAAARSGSSADYVAMVVALLGVSMPSFFLGMLLIMLFSLKLRLLPTAGMSTPLHFILPSITLGLSSAGLVARLTRAAVLDVMGQDYLRTARAKGLAERVVLFRHALRNALLPIITILGLQFGYLMGGAVVVEAVFAWPGMGTLLVDAATRRDLPTLQGTILVFALTFATVNLVVDLLYVALNPQVRYA